MSVHIFPVPMRAVGIVFFAVLAYGCDVTGQTNPPAELAAERQAGEDQRAYAAAYAAYERKDDALAWAGFAALAERKPDAKFMLGMMIREGRGAAPDDGRSYRLLSEAAAAGSPGAAMLVGFMQITGDGAEMNPEAGVALLRVALNEPRLRDSVRKNVESICEETRTRLRSLPSLFDMVKRHLPGKATFCAAVVVANEQAERGHYAECVRDLCQAEEGLGESNSCDALDAEARRVEKHRAMYTRMLAALECAP